jgi:hypothetical protein
MVQLVTRRRRKRRAARNREVKTEDFSTIDPYKIQIVEEEEDTEVSNLIDKPIDGIERWGKVCVSV